MRKKSTVPDRLVSLAMRTIEREGEAAVRIRDICDAAGVAVTAVYNHFGSRDGLIVEAQSRRYAKVIEAETAWFVEQTERCTDVTELSEVLRQLVLRATTPDRAKARLMRLGVMGSSIGRPELTERVNAITAQLIGEQAASLRRLQDRGLLRRDLDVQTLCMWYFGLLTSRSFLETAPKIASLESWNEMTLDALLTVIFGPDTSTA